MSRPAAGWPPEIIAPLIVLIIAITQCFAVRAAINNRSRDDY